MSNTGTYQAGPDGSITHVTGAPIMHAPKPAREVPYLTLLDPLDGTERRQLALYMRFAAETANRECTDYGTLFDTLNIATITGEWL